jgi:hypothetical protein
MIQILQTAPQRVHDVVFECDGNVFAFCFDFGLTHAAAAGEAAVIVISISRKYLYHKYWELTLIASNLMSFLTEEIHLSQWSSFWGVLHFL